ncbi:MAG: efflux RND transporter periplasmic adaptor subunit [Melioribacteraceae bacterium]|nr:efflux RND transporter periplasmic adaptor subunit [Melioribacteraceae bacterium]
MRENLRIVFIFLLSIYGCADSDTENYLEESGTIEMVDVVLSAKTGGEIMQILKNEGNPVNSGDTILIIDPEPLELQLKQAIAVQKTAAAQLKLLETGARTEDRTQAAELLNQARVNLEVAEKDRDRFEKLFDERAITKKQFDDITAKHEISLAQYKAAEANFQKIKKIARDEEVEIAKAQLESAETGMDLLKKNISDCFVTSPINGVIAQKYVERGEIAAPHGSLVKINNLDSAEIFVYISEVNLPKVKIGQTAEIEVDAFPEKSYRGSVTYISPEAEFTPKNIQTKDERTKLVFAVKISVPNTDQELKPGMPADVRIKIDNR